MDGKLIKEFRDLVNSNSYYILHKYRNQNGKNRWNIVCSAMDWITVAIDNYSNFTFTNPREDINKYCMDVFNFISIIDIINEAVIQLHRVLTDSQKSPFKGTKEVFSNNEEIDDEAFFKHARAIFGAHPVNLNKANERWYASWPTKPHFNDFDIQAFLYPLESDREDKTFGIYLSDFREFAESRYKYLSDLADFIVTDYTEFVARLHNETIKFTGDNFCDMKHLLEVHKLRLPNDYITYMIEDTIRFLSVKLSNETNIDIYNRFILRLDKAIADLKNAVQMIDYEEKKSYKIFDVPVPDGQHYEYSKYFEVLHGKYDSLSPYFFEKISDNLKEYVVLDDMMSYEEQDLLIHAALHEYEEKPPLQ